MSLDSILKFFNIDGDLDEDDYYENEYDEEYDEEPKPVSRKKTSRAQQLPDEEDEDTKQRTGFLGSKPKIVSMNRHTMEVNIIKPSTFEDSQEICNMLLSGRPVVVNLEGFDPDDAQRIMDFITGCIYAINGKYHQISKYIFMFSPENVNISGDSLSFESSSSKMPTLNHEF